MEKQEGIFEGYDGISWGTTVEEFLRKNSEAEEIINKNYEMENKKGYTLYTAFGARFYYFYDGKMYAGITVYFNPDATTISAIESKLGELYGTVDGQDKWTAEGEDHVCLYKQITPTLLIKTENILRYDSFGRLREVILCINYINDKISAEAEQFAMEQRKKSIEL